MYCSLLAPELSACKIVSINEKDFGKGKRACCESTRWWKKICPAEEGGGTTCRKEDAKKWKEKFSLRSRKEE